MTYYDLIQKYETVFLPNEVSYGTDKNTTHSYGILYEQLFSPYREIYTNILEIGVYTGASCLAFSEYFNKSKIFGMDITFDHIKYGRDDLRIEYILADGTKQSSLKYFDNIELDLVLDDASHHPDDQIKTAKLFVSKISKNGMFICEDINHTYSDIIRNEFQKIANENKMILDWYDLRHIKNRFDDIVAVLHFNQLGQQSLQKL